MMYLILGLALFFVPHSISIVAHDWRNRVVASMGDKTWRGVYALVSFVGLFLIIKGYMLARMEPVVLYTPPTWMRHITFLLMLPVFPLLIAAYLPGKIQAKLKHPMLVAVKTWAFAHLLANGMLADVLLFGCFIAWAVVDRISLKKRAQQLVVRAPSYKYNDIIAIVAGLGLYVAFLFYGHTWLIGMPLISG